MHHHEFGPVPEDRHVRDAELRELLSRLAGLERVVEPAEATVEAVAEATGVPLARVQAELASLREEDLESRLTERLREAEAPLYSVERPGHVRDPLHSRSWLPRQVLPNRFLDQSMQDRQVTKPEVRVDAGDLAPIGVWILGSLALLATLATIAGIVGLAR